MVPQPMLFTTRRRTHGPTVPTQTTPFRAKTPESTNRLELSHPPNFLLPRHLAPGLPPPPQPVHLQQRPLARPQLQQE
jgi:hypothetical protein